MRRKAGTDFSLRWALGWVRPWAACQVRCSKFQALNHSKDMLMLRDADVTRRRCYQLQSDCFGGLRGRIFLGLDAGNGASGTRDRFRRPVPVGAVRSGAKSGAGVQGAAEEIRCAWRRLYACAAGLEWRVKRCLSCAGVGATAALFVKAFCG